MYNKTYHRYYSQSHMPKHQHKAIVHAVSLYNTCADVVVHTISLSSICADAVTHATALCSTFADAAKIPVTFTWHAFQAGGHRLAPP